MKTKKNPNLLLENQLCFSLYSAANAVTKAYQPLLKNLGVTYPQYLVLLVLWEQDQQSVSNLSEKLFLDSGTLTPLLKRLQSQKIIDRSRSLLDERQVIITLTTKGKSLYSKATKIPESIMCLSPINTDEIKKLSWQLKQIRTAFNNQNALNKRSPK